jgi:hypothetical protein
VGTAARLRNDDTTLIVCLPVDQMPDSQPASPLDAVAELRQFATANVTVRPLQNAGFPESSRRWLLPWNLHEAVS